MRDKYSFVPNNNVPISHQAKRDEIVGLFGINKQTRKQRANEASTRLNTEVRAALTVVGNDAQNAAVHQALHNYEKSHLEGGGNWPQLKAALLLRYRPTLRIVDNLPASADFFLLIAGTDAKVGTMYFDEARFVQIDRPLLVRNDVYKRINDAHNPPRHYIQLTNSPTHVKRYVTRGLSAFDAMNITKGQPLISVLNNPSAQDSEIGGFKHNKLAGVLLNDNEQILTHTRGWGGNKRFISTGVSNRPAISTRGVAFESMYGVVTVDLAMVDVNDIFDVHRHDVATARLGVQAATILTSGHHTGTNDLAEQKYLGLRDTIRTRELLIKGGIPLAALRYTRGARVLLGIGSPSGALHSGRGNKKKSNGFYRDSVEDLIDGLAVHIKNNILSHDHMSFVDPASNLRWHFMEFRTAPDLNMAQNALRPLLNGRTMFAFEKYTQLRPHGMV